MYILALVSHSQGAAADSKEQLVKAKMHGMLERFTNLSP
jgi:hypothetical protein